MHRLRAEIGLDHCRIAHHLLRRAFGDGRAVMQPVPMAGFFANGEFGPVAGVNFVHGYAASAALIYG